MSDNAYQIVIGLEVHVQLKTNSKLFCGCSTVFGAEPNTQVCPVCLGLPGSLPVINKQALQLSVKTAMALDCQIAEFTKWDRKNYYYPDLPKGYQISQFDLPISSEGQLTISDPEDETRQRRIGIIRAHLEEDAGKSMHDELAGRADSRIDLNRTGTPLLEIVSHPDLRSPAEARAYLAELKLLLTYLDVSDCNMQEGSLRVDANINLHIPDGDETLATPIVEVKNLNSFRAVERAMVYEADRQYRLWQERGEKLGDVPKQTRGWDDQAQLTRGQRHKEESSDYRFLPDPDLVPVTFSAAQLDDIRSQLADLPAALRQKLQDQHGTSEQLASLVVNQGRAAVAYFEELIEASGNAQLAGNWFQQDILRRLNEEQIAITDYPVPAAALGQLIRMIDNGELDTARGRDLLEQMLETGQSLEQSIEALGIEQVDDDQLRELCQQLIAENPQVVSDVQSGKQQAVGSLIGKAREKNPNADPRLVRETCLQLIQEM